jgi:hypothetical protein
LKFSSIESLTCTQPQRIQQRPGLLLSPEQIEQLCAPLLSPLLLNSYQLIMTWPASTQCCGAGEMKAE